MGPHANLYRFKYFYSWSCYIYSNYCYNDVCLGFKPRGVVLLFFFIGRLGPSIYRSRPNISRISSTPKVLEIIATPENIPHFVSWPLEKTIKRIEMTPKYKPILWWPPPPLNIHKISFPKNIYFFWKSPKILKFKILNPPKMAQAYVCLKISEYPPMGFQTIEAL